MTKSRGGRQSKRNGTNLWENEEMVGKICWVLRVDVNLSSGPPPHCCPFTLCVYIRDFPQIHCGYNKNFYVPGQELFHFLVTSFALSNWTISYFPLKVTEKKRGILRPTFWPFLRMLHLQSSFFEEIKGGHCCSTCRDLPSMSLCKSTRFTNSIVPKMPIVGSLLIGENPSRCTTYMFQP